MKLLSRLLALIVSAAPMTLAAQPPSQANNLHVSFIDVEGGQATLFVTPGGKSLLVDTGWPRQNGRDADRIVAEAHRAGLKRLDYVLITHYHTDHVGGVPQLAARIPVDTFIDHGPLREMDHGVTEQGYAAYLETLATTKAHRLTLKPGDHLAMDGLELTTVAAAGQVIAAALPGAGQPNTACTTSPLHSPDTADAEQEENVSSLGFVLTWGETRILDLGDLTWDKERELMCPLNKLGKIDLLIVSHHGWDHSSSPALVDAIGAKLAVMDNGATKGGSPLTFQTLAAAPGHASLWQLHYAEGAGALNSDPQHIANRGGQDTGYLLRLIADKTHGLSISKAVHPAFPGDRP